MSKKKIIIVISIVLLIVVILFLVYFYLGNIPKNYNLKFTDDRSPLDGPKKVFYVYDNKVIEEKTQYFPYGHPSGTYSYTITEYKNIKTDEIEDISDVYDAIRDEKGNIILEKSH